MHKPADSGVRVGNDASSCSSQEASCRALKQAIWNGVDRAANEMSERSDQSGDQSDDDKGGKGERNTDEEWQQKSPGRRGSRSAHFFCQSGYITVQLFKAGSIHRLGWHAYSSFTSHGSILLREACPP